MPDAANSKHVDLNSDMGEAFGAYRMGDDEAILAYVTSANVACGFHGGDPEVMATTFASAKEKGVAVGRIRDLRICGGLAAGSSRT